MDLTFKGSFIILNPKSPGALKTTETYELPSNKNLNNQSSTNI